MPTSSPTIKPTTATLESITPPRRHKSGTSTGTVQQESEPLLENKSARCGYFVSGRLKVYIFN
jgi:hypothetical protein